MPIVAYPLMINSHHFTSRLNVEYGEVLLDALHEPKEGYADGHVYTFYSSLLVTHMHDNHRVFTLVLPNAARSYKKDPTSCRAFPMPSVRRK